MKALVTKFKPQLIMVGMGIFSKRSSNYLTLSLNSTFVRTSYF